MAGGNEAALLDALANQPPLTRANVAADACARLRSTAFLRPLVEAHRALDVTSLTELINQIHTSIPMSAVNPRQLDAALGAMRMLHANAAMVAISAQPDPAAAFALVTQSGNGHENAFVSTLVAQYHAAYPAETAHDDEARAALANGADRSAAEAWFNRGATPVSPIAPSPDHPHGWGEGDDAHAAATAAFMDAQLVFSAHDRFHTFGNARRVRRVLYVMGGALAAVIVAYLTFGRPTDSVASAPVHPTVVASIPTPPPATGRHHKKECINVSGASYCTN
jgi:hypothetical protein